MSKLQINVPPTTDSSLKEELLCALEGGDLHQRLKVSQADGVMYQDYLSVGLALQACVKDPLRHDELIERLKPHADIIVGVLPVGLQPHGLLPSVKDLDTPATKVLDLKEINDDQLRQWLVDDSSLIYGELTRKEISDYFEVLSPMLKPGGQFIDLGSGLGKVVISAALHYPFEICTGVEIVSYRHALAVKRLSEVLKAEQAFLEKLNSRSSDPPAHEHPDSSSNTEPGHLKLNGRVNFQLCDMFSCDVSKACAVFVYSTCFGAFMHKIAQKIATQAPKGCIVSCTTYAMDHPGLELIKHFPAKSLAWTDVFFYRRIQLPSWPKTASPSSYSPNLIDWEKKARELLKQLA